MKGCKNKKRMTMRWLKRNRDKIMKIKLPYRKNHNLNNLKREKNKNKKILLLKKLCKIYK